METPTLPGLAATLCVPKDRFYEYKDTLALPFYRSAEEIYRTFRARRPGGEPVPVADWLLARSIDDCVANGDAERLAECVADWSKRWDAFTFTEQELILHAWFRALPKLKKAHYGAPKDPLVQGKPGVRRGGKDRRTDHYVPYPGAR